MNYPYLIVEKNVNGAGEDANEYVRFDTMLQPNQLETLRHCLDRAKATAPKDSDTADMIQEGLRLFEAKTSLTGKLCKCPFYDVIEF